MEGGGWGWLPVVRSIGCAMISEYPGATSSDTGSKKIPCSSASSTVVNNSFILFLVVVGMIGKVVWQRFFWKVV